jgi:hypothetical protein
MADIPPVVVDLAEEAAPAPADDVLVLAEDGDAADKLPPTCTRQEDGSVLVTLTRPVTLRYRRSGSDTVREEVFATLTMRRLTGKQLRQATADTKNSAFAAAALSAGLPQPKFDAVFDAMDAADALDVLTVAGGFLGNGRTTGR